MRKTQSARTLTDICPGPLAPLAELASNLWWSWSPQAAALMGSIDADLWHRTEHNPAALIRALPARRLHALAGDAVFMSRLGIVHREFHRYLHGKTWFQAQYGRRFRGKIAYLCMEYGLHESLPIYAGGLGVLAGDHIKAAGDLGLPLVGVGVLWRNGYVRQHIGRSGTQEDWFVDLSARDLPLREVTSPSGRPLRLRIPLLRQTLVARAWRLDVGRVPLYLLDSDLPDNPPRLRQLSYRLYCNGREDRLCQETLLGVGGLRLLQALRIPISVLHLNEGHAVFASIDRLAQAVTAGRPLGRALREIADTSVFTIHTPVPAGNETFDPDLVAEYYQAHRKRLGMDRKTFLALGRVDADNQSEPFGLTQVALRLSKYRNGVSSLHGDTCRKLWRGVWPDRPVENVPIGSITNGIHVRSWLAPQMAGLLDKYLPADWHERQDQARVWSAVKNISDAELWDLHVQLKADLVSFVRDRMRNQFRRMRASAAAIKQVDRILDPNALTIGFARRFAPYKRAALIFSDPKRLARILNHPTRPVQILFAGKAHPGDTGGQELIARIETFARSRAFRRRVVLVEDYSMDVSRHLVCGVDVWLNNPQRPQEASGTSGMKPALHGGLNLSILDGWWPEACDGRNGWAIGPARDHRGTAAADRRDAAALYRLLEREVVPLYYDRTTAGLPKKWIGRMKHALATIPPAFCAQRMVKQYLRKYYVPAERAARKWSARPL